MSRAIPADPAQRRQTMQLATLAVVLYLSLAAFLFLSIKHRNSGHFLYALDDPYIHLALSENIAHGHYGINPGEPASPSSSVLWPFLLAAFARFSWQPYVPLALNLLAGIAATLLIGAAVARWPSLAAASPRVELADRVLSTVALVFIGNLLGLTFIGMEHTLQVLLAGAGAWGLIACLRGRPIPWWCLVAVASAPLVRYEALSISLAVAVALLGQQQPRRAVGLLLASALPLLLFSVFLHHLGLPWLPTSVLVKSHVPGANGIQQRGLYLLGENLLGIFTEPHHTLVAVLFVTLLGVAWNEPIRPRRLALFGAALAAGLQLLVGRFHWFHRYEVYIVFFSVLILLHVVHERPRPLLGWYALGLFGCSLLYLEAFEAVPLSSHDVYREQYQMHRFANDFYDGNIAVNDLGLVSYRRRPDLYVLDLWGLASPDAARQRDKSTAWLAAEVRAHQVGLVMDYALWFGAPPADWTLLGEVCLNEPPVALGDPCVNYYATPEADLQDLQFAFNTFTATLPKGITVRHPFLPPPPKGPPASPTASSPPVR